MPGQAPSGVWSRNFPILNGTPQTSRPLFHDLYWIINFDVHIDTVENIKGDLKSQERYKIWRVLIFRNYLYEVEALDAIYKDLS